MMTPLLRSPLHGLVSNRLLLLSFTGLKSGKRFTTPVGYEREGNTLIIMTRRSWWKNCQGGVPVSIQYKGRVREARATAVTGTKSIADYIGRSLQRNHPLINARRFGITMEGGKLPQRDILEGAAFGRYLIRIEFQ
jgi:hypothetical protein